MESEAFGILLAVIVTIGIGFIASSFRIPRALRILIWCALGLRIAGAIARFVMVEYLYEGVGDSYLYAEWGWSYAQVFRDFSLAPFYDQNLWREEKWWGTQFVGWPAGLIMAVLGPSFLGSFIIFSLMAFGGLAALGYAFYNAFPNVSVRRYLLWIFLFPSLWFWPSTIGKEAIIILGIGIAFAGFVWRNDRFNWPVFLSGIAVIFAVRPQVAAVVVFAMMLGFWISGHTLMSVSGMIQGLAILVAGGIAIHYAMVNLGTGGFDTAEGFDLEGVEEYLDDVAQRQHREYDLEAAGPSVSGAPAALFNIFFRPLPWETRNVGNAISAAEIWGLWAIVLFRRRNLLNAVRHWRRHRLAAAALIFVIVYAVVLGLIMTNVGIIARQRIFIFPFLFMLLEAFPTERIGNRAESNEPHLSQPAMSPVRA